jgi:hypothetical protein
MNGARTSHLNLDRLQRWALIMAGDGLLLVALGAALAAFGDRLMSPPDEAHGLRALLYYWTTLRLPLDPGTYEVHAAMEPFYRDNPWQQFFQSYLIGTLFWLQVTLGCLVLAMLHHLVGGTWGLATSRLFEAGSRTLLLMALLFLPVILGLEHLYLWTDREVVAADYALRHKAGYLDPFWWIARGIGYFAVWGFFAFLANRLSHRQDLAVDLHLNRNLRRLSAGGIVFTGLAATFASIDWMMSLEPHWFSTIFGAIFAVGSVLGAMALIIPLVAMVADRPPMSHIATPGVFNDFGSLLLAFVMLWTYVAFSQFLIIWSGNLPEEAAWYIRRSRGGWDWIGVALAVLHFALPLLLLLSRDVKRNALALGTLACGILVMRWVDLFWNVAPTFRPAVWVHWLDIAVPVGFGGLWLFVFVWQLRQWPLLAPNDPVWEHHGEYPLEAPHGG